MVQVVPTEGPRDAKVVGTVDSKKAKKAANTNEKGRHAVSHAPSNENVRSKDDIVSEASPSPETAARECEDTAAVSSPRLPQQRDKQGSSAAHSEKGELMSTAVEPTDSVSSKTVVTATTEGGGELPAEVGLEEDESTVTTVAVVAKQDDQSQPLHAVISSKTETEIVSRPTGLDAPKNEVSTQQVTALEGASLVPSPKDAVAAPPLSQLHNNKDNTETNAKLQSPRVNTAGPEALATDSDKPYVVEQQSDDRIVARQSTVVRSSKRETGSLRRGGSTSVFDVESSEEQEGDNDDDDGGGGEDDDSDEEVSIDERLKGILGRRGTRRIRKKDVAGAASILQPMSMGHPVGSTSAEFLERQSHRERDLQARKERVTGVLKLVMEHDPDVSGSPLPDIDAVLPPQSNSLDDGDYIKY